MATAVLVNTVRGGKDPDNFWHLITSDLADELCNEDIWRSLGNYESANDPRVILGYSTEEECREEAAKRGYDIENDVWEAVGY